MSQSGQLQQTDFMTNSGGLNNTDTPFAVKSGQAIAGYNYEYLATGGITKRNGHSILGIDAQLRALGYSLNVTPSNVKTPLRAAGTKLQSFDPLSGLTTSISSDDSTPGTSPFASGTTQPVVFSQFTNPDETVSWAAGGGQVAGSIIGYVNGKYTVNGVVDPAGQLAITTSNTAFLTITGDVTVGSNLILNASSVANLAVGEIIDDGGTNISHGTKVAGVFGTTIVMSLPALGTLVGENISFYGALPDNTLYYYAVSYHKLSTGAQGNAALDMSITTGSSGFAAAGGNTVTLDLSGLTGKDITKYDQIFIYRSSVSAGVPGFTLGDLVAQIPIAQTTYVDYGAVQQTANAVPRTGNTLLDNSQLPSDGVYKTLTKWKNKLITSSGSTLYISDVNKAESWPTLNFITVPSGGPITALGIISYVSPTTASTDELLVIFKEREIWTLSGTTTADFRLLFVDYVGCVAQPLVVFANGFLFWVDYHGIFLYDGSNKPVYLSRLIEYDFSINGDLDLSKLQLGNGDFFRKQNEIVWFLSSSVLGEQKLAIKLDLRLTMPAVQSNFVGRVAEAIFIKDSQSYPIYACSSALPSFAGTFLNEVFYAGDNQGNTLTLFDNGEGDGPNAVQFSFRTKIEAFGLIGGAKRFHKIVVWVRQSTTNDLGLKYWLDYKTDNASSSAYQAQPIATEFNAPIWDESLWDVALWDTGASTYGPLTFNLGNPTIGIEGDALTLEFEQYDYSSPITIIGYTVYWTPTGLRK